MFPTQPGPHPDSLVHTMEGRASDLSKEIGERAEELEARRALGKSRGRLRSLALALGVLVILALAVYLVYLR